MVLVRNSLSDSLAKRGIHFGWGNSDRNADSHAGGYCLSGNRFEFLSIKASRATNGLVAHHLNSYLLIHQYYLFRFQKRPSIADKPMAIRIIPTR